MTVAYPSTVNLFATPIAPPLSEADVLLVQQHRAAAAAAAACASVYRSAAEAAAKDTAARAAQAAVVAAAAAEAAANASSPRTQPASIMPLSPTRRTNEESEDGVAKPSWKDRLNSIADLFLRKESVPWWEQPLQQRKQPFRLTWREELVDFAPLADHDESSALAEEEDTVGLELSFLFSSQEEEDKAATAGASSSSDADAMSSSAAAAEAGGTRGATTAAAAATTAAATTAAAAAAATTTTTTNTAAARRGGAAAAGGGPKAASWLSLPSISSSSLTASASLSGSATSSLPEARVGNAGSLADALVLPSSPTAELFRPIALLGSSDSGRVSAPPGDGADAGTSHVRKERWLRTAGGNNEASDAATIYASDVATAAAAPSDTTFAAVGSSSNTDTGGGDGADVGGTSSTTPPTSTNAAEVGDGQQQQHLQSDSAEMARGWAFSSQLHATSHPGPSVSPPPAVGAVKMVLSSASSPNRSKGSGSGFGFMCPACQHPNAGVWDFGAQRPGPCKTCSAKDAGSGGTPGVNRDPSDPRITKANSRVADGGSSVVVAASSPAEIEKAATAIEAAAAAAFAFASAEVPRNQGLFVGKRSPRSSNIENYVNTYDEAMEMLRNESRPSSGTAAATATTATTDTPGVLEHLLRTSAEIAEEYTPMGAETIVQSRRSAEMDGDAAAVDTAPKFEGVGRWWHRAADTKSSPVAIADPSAAAGEKAADGMPISRKLF